MGSSTQGRIRWDDPLPTPYSRGQALPVSSVETQFWLLWAFLIIAAPGKDGQEPVTAFWGCFRGSPPYMDPPIFLAIHGGNGLTCIPDYWPAGSMLAKQDLRLPFRLKAGCLNLWQQVALGNQDIALPVSFWWKSTLSVIPASHVTPPKNSC